MTAEDNDRQIEAEVDVWPRTAGTRYDPPDGGPELQCLRINNVEVTDPWNGDYDDIIERMEELAEEKAADDLYDDGREL